MSGHIETHELRSRLEASRKIATDAITKLDIEKGKAMRIKCAIINISDGTAIDGLTGREAIEAVLLACEKAEEPGSCTPRGECVSPQHQARDEFLTRQREFKRCPICTSRPTLHMHGDFSETTVSCCTISSPSAAWNDICDTFDK